MNAPEPSNSVAALTAPELCTVCGESICDGDVVDELDGQPAHEHCKDSFIAQLELHEARKLV